ncbi:hypothetical protein HPB47_004367 [Ixodes persulcatus]|uniref:Uncharacterized protein n=1 Tax=Ixodes persulcatus TaxID=34615 RepID=A0AC60PGT0_IXOPE|nr:hypothetical protein HPB47_004367 [Ixodes persulcatus]
MHPEHHPDRRKARSAALHKRDGQLEGVMYTDAAEYPHQKAMTMVATDGHGVPLSGGSIPTTNSETAEEVAIAIALLVPNTQTIISDSKRAILNFARGRISEATLRVLTRTSKIINDMVSLIWAPAHTSLPGNEAAPRRTLPAGHKSLTKSQEWTWRRLQTNTYPNPALYSHWFPDIHSELESGRPEGLQLGRGSSHGLGFATLPLFCFIVEEDMGCALNNTWPSLHFCPPPPHVRLRPLFRTALYSASTIGRSSIKSELSTTLLEGQRASEYGRCPYCWQRHSDCCYTREEGMPARNVSLLGQGQDSHRRGKRVRKEEKRGWG